MLTAAEGEQLHRYSFSCNGTCKKLMGDNEMTKAWLLEN